MRNLMRMQWPRPLGVLGVVVVAVVLSGDLNAAEQAPRVWLPAPSVPPRGPFFGPPGAPIPSPVPSPFPYNIPGPYPNLVPPFVPQLGMTRSTDRSLVVVPPAYDPQFLRPRTAEIDPGILAAPRVQGLPIQRPGWRPGR